MDKKILLYGFLLAGNTLFADRWLVLPPRIENTVNSESLVTAGQNTAAAADLARAMALYLRASRISHVVSVAEAEGCLKQENISMEQKIAPELIGRVAKNCQAERVLLTRLRRRSGEFEVTSKVYFRESDMLTDTLVKSGDDLQRIIGEQLNERFSARPATPKESSRDLIVAGDTFGAAYFDWQQLKPFFLSLDSVKSAYCLLDAQGKLQTYRLRSDKQQEKEFIDRLRFEGGYSLQNPQAMAECIRRAQAETLREGRRAVVVLVVSAQPQDAESRLKLKAALRQIAAKSKLLVVPTGNATEPAARFWAQIARELGDDAQYLPTAQRARAGLSGGQEWYIFRRGGRLFESRSAEPEKLAGGVLIPEKYADMNGPQDLLKLYATLSGNKVVSAGDAQAWNGALTNALMQSFRTTGASESWRVMLEQNGLTYYLSLAAPEARKLKVGDYARIYTELLPGSEREMLRNRPSPVVIIDKAHDSAASLEINVGDFLRKPSKYLRRSMGGRSFYIMTGKVLRVSPPERDALDDGF
ncbi:MAG: hypothetical protein OHK0011_04210 [Turneriella sp.]